MLFENKRFREFTYVYAVVSVLFLVATWFIFGALQKSIDKKYLRFTAEMMAEYDDSQGKITYSENNDDIDAAMNALRDMGYEASGIYKMYTEVQGTFLRNRWKAECVVLVFAVVVYVLTVIYVRRTFGRLRQLTKEMNQSLETGNLDYTSVYEEGVIGRLDDAYHTLVNALKQSKENELHDKEFLRDTLQDISHQLKTPIASLTVFNDLLLDGKLDTEEEKIKILEENHKQLDRMKRLVLSMLKMARLDADSVRFDMKECRLADTLEMALSGITHEVKERGYVIHNYCNEDIMLLHDADWLAEAFGNILVNASDHMEPGGTIDINVESNAIFTRISIKDNGHGISEEELLHIFERFHRGSNNPNPNSVGIGLALTKAIITGQNGDITVRSEEGQYTEFIITFFR
ncbi:MAG: HAMP domain-containing histidine kinase [Coprococcus sp.]|nr:HAMP domain-containing histidine kinase [Coprococcus sp.]